MKHTQNKSNGMTRHMRILPVFLVAAVALVLGVVSPNCWAGIVELDEAEIFFEENVTDGDLGIQFFLDGEAWTSITIFTPDWRRNVKVSVKGNLRQIGLTEIFSESAEPSFDELPRDEFLVLFPEGVYHFFGWTVEGDLLTGAATLTHNLPAAPELEVEGFPFIEWIPGDGVPEPVGYEVVAEMVIEEDEDERVFVNTATLPAFVTQFTVSKEFARLAKYYERIEVLKELKVEVIVREASGNKTITEEFVFELKEDEE